MNKDEVKKEFNEIKEAIKLSKKEPTYIEILQFFFIMVAFFVNLIYLKGVLLIVVCAIGAISTMISGSYNLNKIRSILEK